MIIAVDFDGTVVDHRYPEIGEEAPFAVETLRKLTGSGHKLILYTMRSDEYLDDAIRWFNDRGIPLYGIQYEPHQREWSKSNKCYAELYIDDAAFGCWLVHPRGFNRPCIDWNAVQYYFDTKVS